MSFVRRTVSDAAVGVAVTDGPAGLATISKPGCAAAIWRRPPDTVFQTWIDALDPTRLPEVRVILRPTDVREAVADICDIHDTPVGPERTWLTEDIAALAHNFADIMGVRHIGLRLTPVNTNACRRFHLDALTARLICTYRGAGTQYGISTDGTEPKRVFTTPMGAPIVLRGNDWPTAPASGLLHRSPPVEGTGETRLVLVLDPIDDPDDAV